MIKVFDKEIPLYGICFFLGIIISVILAFILVIKEKKNKFDFLCCSVYILIGAIIGAKLLFILVSIDMIVEYQLTFIQVIKGGFVFYGGLLGGALGAFIYGKQFKLPISTYIDIFAIVLPLGHAVGRIGCFFSGCCYGIEYHGFLNHIYHQSSNAFTPIGVPLFPVQLLESFLLLIIFISLVVLYSKKAKTGTISIVYLISYSVIRFILEFLRGDAERGGILGLSTSQWISIAICVVLILRYIYIALKKEKY